MLSLRPDLLGNDVAAELAKLQSDVPPDPPVLPSRPSSPNSG
jgi:predicted unusual protein kinase regulating ubiquinone biosynthesis (AarF/ABC1/UbiB family)